MTEDYEVIELDIDRLNAVDIRNHFNTPRLENMLNEVKRLTSQEIIIQDLIRKIEGKEGFRVTKTGGNGFVIVMITDRVTNKRFKFRY